MLALPPGAEAIPAKAPTWMIRSSNMKGRVAGAEHAFGGFLGARQRFGIERQRNRELVAAEPRDHRIRAKLVGQCAGDAFEQAVAGLIAVLVVDRLEAVDLERDDGEAARRAPRPRPHISAARSAKPLRL